jgi:hypothetical protein
MRWPEGLFEAQSDFSVGVERAQLLQPLAEIFWRSGQSHRLGLARGRVDEVEVGFFIGAVQADDQIIGWFGVDHN